MSRKVLILANVGLRDVLYQGKLVAPARWHGKELLERYDEAGPEIEVPIISSGLRYVESLSARYPAVVERSIGFPEVRLFCSDQREDSEHHKDDTLEFARLIAKKLPAAFPNRKQNKGIRLDSRNSVTLEPVQENPSRYDKMYRFYEDFYRSAVEDPEEWLCFVLASGGTPAMNAMLLLHSIRHFGSNCVQVYVPPGEDPVEMRVGRQIAEADARRRFNEALDSLQFRAAASIAESSFGGYRVAACRFAEHRLAFDFRRAREHCQEAAESAEARERSYFEDLAEVVDRLELGATNRSNQALLIKELFYNLQVKHRLGEFVDMLGRIFRLQEAVLGQVVEDNTKIRLGKGKSLANQMDAVEATPGLREHLENYQGPRKKLTLNWNLTLNRVSLEAVVEHLEKLEAGLPEDRRTRATAAVKIARSIDSLSELRNNSILGHGFEGISEEEIDAAYGSKTLIADLRASVGAALGKDLSMNPFLELSERLKF